MTTISERVKKSATKATKFTKVLRFYFVIFVIFVIFVASLFVRLWPRFSRTSD